MDSPAAGGSLGGELRCYPLGPTLCFLCDYFGHLRLDFSPNRYKLAFAVPLPDKIQRLIDEFSVIDDPQERLALVVDRARRLPPLNDAERIESHRVRGCVSQAWIVGELRDGQCRFRCDADSPLVKGLLGFLCECFSEIPPATVATSEADPLGELGLLRNLSPTRQNGLAHARARIRELAGQLAPPPGG
ncbi:MAG: SufE family protein [Opitutae bacterium]|nr:SufE family protein [Opitutae bacterium]